MFLEGNKKIVNLVANKEMIRCGQEIIVVPIEKNSEYFVLLINYYETNDMTNIKEWIRNNCVDGI